MAPPIQQPQVQPQPIIKYVDQNGNPVAPPNNARAVNPNAQGGGRCKRITVIVLWSISIFAGIPQSIMGPIRIFWLHGGPQNFYHPAIYILSLILPGLVSIIGGSISICCVNSYNYSLSIVSIIASGVLLLSGIMLFTVKYGIFWFFTAYIASFVLYKYIHI